MIRFLFRFVGLFGLAFGFVFLVYDGTKSIANRTVEMTTVERFWNEVYPRARRMSCAPSPRLSPIGSGIR